ncbi:MAG: NAD-dependent epimerase/dehydratase family protein [Candidatus Berkelbacteria bacterium]|nr:NAD-dependent epimerase/dehydratase family protein [Candidatus Berkelbacteria bacterium]
MNKKVLIIGGTGFIGYHATLEFLKEGYEVSIITLPPEIKKGLLPERVKITYSDLNKISDQQTIKAIKGNDSVVFAAGADDRITPQKPAYRFFYDANVKSAKRFFELAQKAGAKRGVLFSSYFAYFARVWPEMKLDRHHPYIRSRVVQESEVISVCNKGLEVMVLEFPYIFGAAPDKKPLWCPLLSYLEKTPYVFYTRGSTNCVSVKTVARAVVGAIKNGKAGERYVIGDQNLTWKEMLSGLMKAMGIRKKIIILPNIMAKIGVLSLLIKHKLQGREGGLSPIKFVNLQTRNTYFKASLAQKELDFEGGDLEEAFSQTAKACANIYPT